MSAPPQADCDARTRQRRRLIEGKVWVVPAHEEGEIARVTAAALG